MTGFLTGFDAAEIAARIIQVITDRPLRDTLSANARAVAAAEYASAVFARTADRHCGGAREFWRRAFYEATLWSRAKLL